MSNFRPLEVVGRSSETQLQVGEHLNNLVGDGLGCTYSAMRWPHWKTLANRKVAIWWTHRLNIILYKTH